MGNALHSSVAPEITDDLVKLLDQRTGLHIGFPRLSRSENLREMLGEEFYRTIQQLGFFDEVSIPELRARQHEIRTRLQREVRDDVIRGYGEFITENVPYYRDGLKLKPADLSGRDSLPNIPILSRTDLRKRFNELLADGVSYSDHLADGRMVWTRTSGTTSERVQVPVDLELDRVPPDYDKIWNLDHGDKVPRTAVLATPRCSPTECYLSTASMKERTRFGNTLFMNSHIDIFNLGGEQLINFNLGLVFLGFGWSFVHVGASTLLVTTLPQADQSKAQMINELFIWAASATAAGASGWVLATIGWYQLVALGCVPICVMAGVAVVSNRRRKSWLLPAS